MYRPPVPSPTPEPTATSSPSPAPTAGACEIYGDLNLNGKIEEADASTVEQIVNGEIKIGVTQTSDNQYMRAVGDVNGDQNITPDDAMLIREYVQGTNSTFPVCEKAKTSPWRQHWGCYNQREHHPNRRLRGVKNGCWL